ncbi:hypothetical protein [Polaromonas sp.]|uniref:hypothetical protein n=1 Tax=Polaromonas sp. TaxID=1869339 RepID=UPI003CC584A2
MQPAVDVNPWGPLAAPDEAFRGAHLFEYESGGQHALIAVRPVVYRHGRRLDVVGFRSLGDRVQGAAIDRALMDLGAKFDADLLALCTQVPHVAKTLIKNNWMVTGAVLLKAKNGQ